MRLNLLVTTLALALATSSAFGAYTITQGTSAPTYGTTITFDEPGVPVGENIDPFTYYADDGITFSSGAGFVMVSDYDATEFIAGGNGDGNQIGTGFSLVMLFEDGATEASWQGWAPGSPNPPFGGINVFLLNDGEQVGDYSGSSPFGGVGDEWFNVTTSDGDTFDEIRFFNGAFNSFNTYADNVSFNVVPEPSSLVLCGLASLVGLALRRRR